MSSQGIVIGRKFRANQDGHAASWCPIDPATLRWYALYWDKIDIPHGIIGGDAQFAEESGDLEILRQEGFLVHTRGHLFYRQEEGDTHSWKLTFEAENPRPFSVTSTLYALQKHQSSEPNWKWAIERQSIPDSPLPQGASHFVFVEPQGDKGVAIGAPADIVRSTTEMYSAGPVLELEFKDVLVQPAANTPLEEILDFRSRRQDELGALRIGLGELYQRIISSGDPQHALELEKAKLERLLRSMNKVANERFSKKLLSSFQVSLDWERLQQAGKAAIGAGMTVAGAGRLKNLPEDVVIYLGGLAAVGTAALVILKPNPAQWFIPKLIPENQNDFMYLYHAGKEFSS